MSPERDEAHPTQRTAQHNLAPPGSAEARDLAALLHPTTDLAAHARQGPLVIERASGVRVWDNRGREYIEALAGLWCTALGYGEERLADAAARQMRALSFGHLFGGRSHEPAIALAERLKAMVPVEDGRVFFGTSGSDANDTQIKLVRYYFNAIGRPEKKKILSRRGAYHGVTVASGSRTGLAAFHKHFDLPIDGVLHLSCPHHYREGRPGESEAAFAERLVAELEETILREGPETVAAFIAEPVMGAGGVIPPPAGYFEGVQRVLERHDVMLIADEVITGFGRTGRAFACETYAIRPTTVSLAKALSSAYLPISAVVIPGWMYEPIAEASGEVGVFGHGFTYSGHPVCAAVALEALDIMEERRIFAHAADVSERFQTRLAALGEHALVGEARGVGLIGAVELVADKVHARPFDPAVGAGKTAIAHLEAHGAIARALGDAVALCPPLVIGHDDVDALFDRLEAALDDTAEALRAHRHPAS